MEMDCTLQLKNLMKKFYKKKSEISENLMLKLDAILRERPK